MRHFEPPFSPSPRTIRSRTACCTVRRTFFASFLTRQCRSWSSATFIRFGFSSAIQLPHECNHFTHFHTLQEKSSVRAKIICGSGNTRKPRVSKDNTLSPGNSWFGCCRCAAGISASPSVRLGLSLGSAPHELRTDVRAGRLRAERTQQPHLPGERCTFFAAPNPAICPSLFMRLDKAPLLLLSRRGTSAEDLRDAGKAREGRLG